MIQMNHVAIKNIDRTRHMFLKDRFFDQEYREHKEGG